MHYEFPKEGKIVLAFRGPDSMLAELTHYPDAVVIWRPADTQVWPTTADGHCEQIAGFADNLICSCHSGTNTIMSGSRECPEIGYLRLVVGLDPGQDRVQVPGGRLPDRLPPV
jgi:hypothetical protein